MIQVYEGDGVPPRKIIRFETGEIRPIVFRVNDVDVDNPKGFEFLFERNEFTEEYRNGVVDQLYAQIGYVVDLDIMIEDWYNSEKNNEKIYNHYTTSNCIIETVEVRFASDQRHASRPYEIYIRVRKADHG